MVAALVADLAGGGFGEGGGVEPLGSAVDDFVGDAVEGRDAGDQGAVGVVAIPELVGIGYDAEWLSAVEAESTVEFPSGGKAGKAGSSRDLIVQQRGERVPGVVVAVAVLQLLAVAVLGKIGDEAGLVVERVAPGVDDLRGEAVVVGAAQRCLEAVVVGIQVAVELVDVADVRILRKVRTSALLIGVVVRIRWKADGWKVVGKVVSGKQLAADGEG